MKTQHTPGPWRWNGVFNVTVGSGASWIARTVGLATGDGTDTEREPNEARANGRLIAAAPELLAACEAALEAVRICAVYAGARDAGLLDSSGNWPLHNMLAAAINKARGA